jgi:glycosyltransferase involved in cell wall biosynthesis
LDNPEVNSSSGEKISVCLLTFNHVGVVESTLRTVLDQSAVGYEVVVSDDCSSDGTWEAILLAAKSDARLVPIRTPRRMGMPGNANFAVANCARPYIALLHHDDLYRSDLLERWASNLDRFPDVGFVFNPYGTYGSAVVSGDPMPADRIDGHWLLEQYLLPRWGCIVRGTAMIRRESWEQVGGMRTEFGLLADVDLWMRLAMSAPVGYVAEPVITVRHQRPTYYPTIYSGTQWSWERQRLLYEIHASNRLKYLDIGTVEGRVRWWWFRARLSAETLKWLIYGVVRRRPDIVARSGESATTYDLLPLRLVRAALSRLYGQRGGVPPVGN